MKKIGATLSVLMMTLTACSVSGASDEFKPSLDANTTCEIKVVGNYSNFEALEAEFDKFNGYYPKVELSYVKLDDYDNTLATALNGNDKPNIFFAEPKMIGSEKYASVVSHMEELSDANLKINLDCVRSSLINRDSNGKVFMIPVFSRTYGALINEDLFTKENLSIPTTWNGLLDTCAAFINKGYASPIMGYTKDKKPSSGLMNAIAYPLFIADLAKNPEALKLANELNPSAGEYMRSALGKVKTLVDNGSINLEECQKIGDNYEKVLLRFFEGDVPMMVCNGDTVSGAKKREGKSGAYEANPFKYAFYSIPVTDQGGYFIDSASLEFAVNKDCDNLDMTNEFMRFLIRTQELDNMASIKGLISPTNTKPFPPVYFEVNKVPTYTPIYNPFNNISAEFTISPEVIGVTDQLATQIRIASYQVGKGEMTIDEAVANYGSFK